MSVNYVDDGNDDGTNFGRSDGKIGFYGLTTPIAQQDFTAAAVTDSPLQYSTVWGFANSSISTNIVALLNEIRAKLVALNLVAT